VCVGGGYVSKVGNSARGIRRLKGGGGGGIWGRHKITLVRLEPTRTSVRSPGAKMERVVGEGDKSQRLEGWGRWRVESGIRQS
jgi:hypothetical protein